MIFTVYAGYYGYASKLVNRKTKSTVHKKSRDEADVKPFYVVVVIPNDTEISKAQSGLILFQEIGIYGVKTCLLYTSVIHLFCCVALLAPFGVSL